VVAKKFVTRTPNISLVTQGGRAAKPMLLAFSQASVGASPAGGSKCRSYF